MLWSYHNPAIGMDCKSTNRPCYGTREPQLARRVQKQQQAFAYAIALAFGPKAAPFVDSKVLARCKGELGQYLDDESRRKVRKYLRQRLRELAPKS